VKSISYLKFADRFLAHTHRGMYILEHLILVTSHYLLPMRNTFVWWENIVKWWSCWV